ncbi:MAG: MFS transporter [Alicyclobacillus sp.]|nr:MFS transporter [Alicyclobacillus sp.]
MNKRVIWTLCFGHFTNDLLNGVLGAILPLLTVRFHLNYTQVGVLMMVSNVSSSLVQPLIGLVADKKGNPWLLPFSALALGVGLVWLPFAPSFAWLLPAVVLGGMGSATFHPDASRAAFLAAGRQRGLAQSIFQIGGNTGTAVSALSLWFLGNVTGLPGTAWFMVLAVLSTVMLSLIVRWFAAQLQEQRAHAASAPAGRRRPAGASSQDSDRFGLAVLVAVICVRAWIIAAVITFVPLYIEQRFGVPARDVWVYTFVFLLCGAAGTMVGGTLVDWFGRRTLTRLSMWISAPFAVLLPFLSKGWLVADLAVLGFFLLSTFAVAVVYGQEMMPNNIAMVSGMLIGFTGGIGGFGTMLMGSLADGALGLHATLAAFLWLVPLAAVCSIWLPRDRVRPARAR